MFSDITSEPQQKVNMNMNIQVKHISFHYYSKVFFKLKVNSQNIALTF